MKAMRHRPAWSICRVCAMAHRSTTDFRRGRYSDLSPGSHRTLVGWANLLVSAREGRPGNGSGVSGAVVAGPAGWHSLYMHARQSLTALGVQVRLVSIGVSSDVPHSEPLRRLAA